jgi:hypothetical protein
MSEPVGPVLSRFNPAQGGVRGMRIIATGMLVVMAAIFLLASHYDHLHPAWGFVRAFAEAAMVGGLADWFAVTACSGIRSACRSRTPPSSPRTRIGSAPRWPSS